MRAWNAELFAYVVNHIWFDFTVAGHETSSTCNLVLDPRVIATFLHDLTMMLLQMAD
jgi:hypothetical protein